MALRVGVTWLASLLVALAGCGDNAAEAPAVGLQAIAITPALPTLAAGTSVQLTATGTDADGQTLDLSSMVNWTSALTDIAKVSPTGVLTGVLPGDVTIAASRGGVTGTITATVGDGVLVGLKINATSGNLEINQLQLLTAIGTFSDGFKADLTSRVTWTSDSPAHITVSAFGVVTGIAPGFATITATQGAVTGSLPMSVDQPVPIAIEIASDPPRMFQVRLGDTLQLVAVATMSDLTTRVVTAPAVRWISDDAGIATVDASGLVTPFREGAVGIVVAIDALSTFTRIVVLPAL